MSYKKTGPKRDQQKYNDVLAYIREYSAEHSFPPTQQNMAENFGVNRSTIQYRLRVLVEQGKLENKGKRGHIPVKGARSS